MPLREDGEYRGAHAIHVHSHRKLGRHRTLIRASLPVVNWMIDHDQITMVDFQRVVSATGIERYTHRAECKVTGDRIHVMLVARNSAQTFRIKTRSAEAAVVIAEEIQQQWLRTQAAND